MRKLLWFVLLVCCGSVALAASPSYESMRKQLDDLEAKVNQMTPDQISGENQAKSVSRLGKLSLAEQKGGLPAVGDRDEPFEELPATAFSLALLQLRNHYANHQLVLGGYFEFDPQAWQTDKDIVGNTGAGHEQEPDDGVGVYSTTFNLDFMNNLNDWATWFVSSKAENLGSSGSNILFISKAFVNIGNLDKSPYYMTIGKMHPPFGVFGGNGPWSDALPKAEMRPGSDNVQVVAGYFKHGVDASVTLLNNKMHADASNMIYHLRYDAKPGKWNYGVGMGYLLDIRRLGAAYGSAFSGSAPILSASGNIGTYDLNARIGYDKVSLFAEFVQAVRSATMLNVPAGTTVATAGENIGRATVWDVMLSYAPDLWGKPTEFMLSYSGSHHLQGVPVSLSQNPDADLAANNGIMSVWIAGVQQELTPGFFVGLEFQTAETYAHRWAYVETIDLSVYF